MALRPRKRGWHKNKFGICKRCGGRIRRHMARCKKCNESQG